MAFDDFMGRVKKGIKWFATGETEEKKDIKELLIESRNEEVPEKERKKVIFTLDKRPTLQELPEFAETQQVDVRYPLIPPYAYAHIYWSNESNELIYELEEPPLDDLEKNL